MNEPASGFTDDEGDVVDDYTYDVFGAVRSQSGSSENYWLFTGEQQDADSAMYYLRARYYDPVIGRFLSQDPLPIGNLYTYARNNPVRFADPSGLCIPGYNCPPGLGGGTQPPSLPLPECKEPWAIATPVTIISQDRTHSKE